jgi:hypothetical protein
MGIDFLRTIARPFKKGLDRRRIELGTPDLFSRRLQTKPRSYAASVDQGQCLVPGESLSVCLAGDQVLALRGLSPVARVDNPSGELIQALRESFGEGAAIVQAFHDIAAVAEITIC